jgi:PAS domain S-box-containing protein
MKTKKQAHDPNIEALLEYTKNIIATLREPFLVLDKDLQVISANHAFYATFKTPEKETIGQPLPNLDNGQWNIPELLRLLKEIIPGKKVIKDYEVEYKFRQIGARTMILNALQLSVPKKVAAIIAARTEEAKKEEELIMLAIEDITERKRLQVELKESEERYRRAFEISQNELAQIKELQYRTLIENLPGKVFLKDKNSTYISCNENYAKDLKIKSEEIAGKTDYDFFPTYLAEKYREDDKRVMESGQTENIEEEYMVMKDFLRGAQKTIINTAKVPVRDKDGNVTGLFGLFWDITERKKMEETLRESEETYRALFNESKDAMMTVLPDKGFLSGNPEAVRIFGCRDEKDFTSRSPSELSPEYQPDGTLSSDKAQEMMRLTLEKGSSFFEWTHRRVDGTEFLATVLLSKVGKGDETFLQATVRDITEHKLVEKKLLHFQKALESSTDAIGMATPDGIHYYQNEAFTKLFGLSIDEVNDALRSPPAIYVDERVGRNIFDVIMNGGAWTGEVKMLTKDKRKVDISLRAYSIKDEKGKVIGLVGIHTDITERKLLEAELNKAQILKAAVEIKSKFTSMVSHELRSPMAVIKESINLLTEGLAGSVTPEQKGLLDTAKSNIDRLGRLINNTLDFQKIEAGKMELDKKEYDLNEMVLATSKEMNVLAEEKGLSFTVNIDESIPAVCFDKDKIIQVLTNLLSNAIKFTEKGAISVSTEREDNMAHIMVEDTGFGIQIEDIPKLFQAFEQLGGGLGKRKGGTGLGLAISKEIVQAHNGKMWAESQPGKGSTFHFTLPIKERRE